jgi:hypothetical protein
MQTVEILDLIYHFQQFFSQKANRLNRPGAACQFNFYLVT